MASCAARLAVLAALVVAVGPATASQRGTGTLPPPGIRTNPAWLTVTTGATNPSQLVEPQVWAITARSNVAALVPFDLFNGLRNLSASGVVIWATTSGTGGPTHVFKAAAWPPRLSDFRLDRVWKGQQLRRIQQRLLWIAAGGWRLDVRVYFGTQRPGTALLASAQAELNRLTLPAR